MRAAQAVIDGKALIHNVRVVRSRIGDRKIWAVVKANAYGHGLAEVANVLRHEVDGFAVSCVEEAAILRANEIQQPILLLEGPFEISEFAVAERLNLELAIHSEKQLKELLGFPFQKAVNVWIKCNSGMNRLGFHPDRLAFVYEALLRCRHVRKPVGLMTHFANADNPGDPLTLKQWRRFCTAIDGKTGRISAANSAAIINYTPTLGDWVRPGLMLYGCSPNERQTGSELGLIPAMTLRTQVIATHRLRAGDTVGYGATWCAQRATNVVIAAIGYGDGYPRHARNGTPVWVAGQIHALAGRVSMDMIAIDIGQRDDVKIGDPVILWGKELPVELVASAAGTIPYELLCSVSQRVNYVYL